MDKHLQRIISQSFNEKEIEEYKEFYQRYLTKIRDRRQLIAELYPICQKFYEKETALAFDQEFTALKREAKTILEKYFSNEVLSLYEKELPPVKSSKSIDKVKDSFWLSLLATFADGFEELRQTNKQELNYKKNFLIFLNNCLVNYGLHPNILKRNAAEHKKFNLHVIHYLRSRKPLTVMLYFMTYEQFCDRFLKLYLDKKPLKVDGQLIPFDKIHQIKITTTLLKEDEIALFGLKCGFIWTETHKDVEKFIHSCVDETETYHPNPFDPSTYTREINLLLIAQTKNFLSNFIDARKLYEQAIEKFERNLYNRNTLDDLRLALEVLLKNVLKNKKSLENQVSDLGKLLKQKGASKEIANMFQKILDYFAEYQNNHVKHADEINSNEVEFIINLTSTLMRYVINL